MEITVAIIIMAVTLVAGEITKVTNIPNKYIPLQNIVIAIMASIVCIVFKVEDMGILETIITCIFGTMSAGGLADLAKTKKVLNLSKQVYKKYVNIGKSGVFYYKEESNMNIIETNLEFNKLTPRTSTNRILLHNSGVKVRQSVEVIHNYHKNTLKWAGIGYHFYIRTDGSIYRGRPENMIGAHATGSNSDSIGICFEGNFNEETMPEVQKEAGKWLISYLTQKPEYSISVIQRHSDVCKTDCPGKNFPFDEIVNGQVIENTTVQVVQKNEGYTHKDFVKEVQSAIGAKVDGIEGPETLSKTVTVSKTKNRKHAVVRPIQKYLYSIGYTEVGDADGTAGVKFDTGVRRYQKDNGCVCDGEITARNKTWKKLLKLA